MSQRIVDVLKTVQVKYDNTVLLERTILYADLEPCLELKVSKLVLNSRKSVLIGLLLCHLDIKVILLIFIYINESMDQACTEETSERIERHEWEKHLKLDKYGHDKS